MNLPTTDYPVINGRQYPLWSQLVAKADQWIGGTLEEEGAPLSRITGITLRANGEESAFFEVEGDPFGCGFDVRYGGITGGEDGWLTFSGYGGHTFRIKEAAKL